MLRCEHPGFDSDERGARDSNANPLPLALPHPGFKTGTFYLAQKRNFLLCVDTRNVWGGDSCPPQLKLVLWLNTGAAYRRSLKDGEKPGLEMPWRKNPKTKS